MQIEDFINSNSFLNAGDIEALQYVHNLILQKSKEATDKYMHIDVKLLNKPSVRIAYNNEEITLSTVDPQGEYIDGFTGKEFKIND